MKLSPRVFPQLVNRLAFIDAATGLENPALAVVEVDDTANTLTVQVLSDLLDRAVPVLRVLHVPRVVIDLERLTVLYNVGAGFAVSMREAQVKRGIDEGIPLWP